MKKNTQHSKVSIKLSSQQKRDKRYYGKNSKITFRNNVVVEFRDFQKRSGIMDNTMALKYLWWCQRISGEDDLDLRSQLNQDLAKDPKVRKFLQIEEKKRIKK